MICRIEALRFVRGTLRALIWITCIALGCTATCCQKRKLIANEELRLPEDKISAYRMKAEQGDADAAKRLWHHYTFVAGDLQEGKKWKERYYVLTKEH